MNERLIEDFPFYATHKVERPLGACTRKTNEQKEKKPYLSINFV